MHAARKYAATRPLPKTFVELVRRNEGKAIHLVKTYDQDTRPCWFLLRSDEHSLAKLEHTEYDVIIDLTRFGEIMDSGWGHMPGPETDALTFGKVVCQ